MDFEIRGPAALLAKQIDDLAKDDLFCQVSFGSPCNEHLIRTQFFNCRKNAWEAKVPAEAIVSGRTHVSSWTALIVGLYAVIFRDNEQQQ